MTSSGSRGSSIAIYPDVVDEITRLGLLRTPQESCGVVLINPGALPVVLEIPNTSDTPTTAFAMEFETLIEALDQAGIQDNAEVITWHTHPNGFVGPSHFDLEWKRDNVPEATCLVVALPSGTATLF